jgi:hypothetical protein
LSPSIRRCVKRAQTSCYFNRWTGNLADRLAGARRTNSRIAGKSVTLSEANLGAYPLRSSRRVGFSRGECGTLLQ